MPSASGWDLYAIHRRPDLHAALAELRERSAVHALADGVFVVARFAEAEHALRAAELHAGSGVAASFAGASLRLGEVMKSWLMSLDGAPHDRARGLVRREFTPRRVEALRPSIGAAARRLADDVAARAQGGRVDLVRGFAFALPSEVIRALFGIPEREWRERVEPLFEPREGAPPGAFLDELAGYFFERFEAAAALSPDGLLARLLVSDAELGALSPLEVVANAVLLVSAAIHTTTGLIANTLLCLARAPGALARVRRSPELAPRAVEETLRFEPPALSCSRFAARELTLGEHVVPAGAHVLISIAAASRDPLHFPDPDRFSLDRPESPRVLAFGGGRHVCLGAALARLEAELALREILRAAPGLRVETDVCWRGDSPTVRAPRALFASLG
jgi:cytochrome P450